VLPAIGRRPLPEEVLRAYTDRDVTITDDDEEDW